MSQNNTVYKNKIFLIGFIRCGSKSISTFFRNNGYATCDFNEHGGDLGKSIFDNFLQGNDLISSKYQNYTVYSDMDYVYGCKDFPCYGYRFYQKLDQQYPDAKFILNLRPLMNWIQINQKNKKGSYFRFCKNIYGFSDQQLFLHWSEHYQNHVSEVKNYFFDKPEKLLTFDITKDNSNKMINFLDTFYLNQKYWT